MALSYNLFTAAFLAKVTDYEFLRLESFERSELVDGYMKRACAQFNKICVYDLSDCDDAAREFCFEIEDEDIDELVDIVSEGMLVQWMKGYFYRADNLENVLNTNDFSQYSPAELLYRITTAYKAAKKDFTNMMREYSFNHGDLSGLAL